MSVLPSNIVFSKIHVMIYIILLCLSVVFFYFYINLLVLLNVSIHPYFIQILLLFVTCCMHDCDYRVSIVLPTETRFQTQIKTLNVLYSLTSLRCK